MPFVIPGNRATSTATAAGGASDGDAADFVTAREPRRKRKTATDDAGGSDSDSDGEEQEDVTTLVSAAEVAATGNAASTATQSSTASSGDRVAELEGEVRRLREAAASSASAAASSGDRVAELEGEVRRLREAAASSASAAALQSLVGVLQERITELEGKLVVRSTDGGPHHRELADAFTRASAATIRAEAAEAQVAALEAQQLVAQVHALRNAADRLEGDISATATELEHWERDSASGPAAAGPASSSEGEGDSRDGARTATPVSTSGTATPSLLMPVQRPPSADLSALVAPPRPKSLPHPPAQPASRPDAVAATSRSITPPPAQRPDFSHGGAGVRSEYVSALPTAASPPMLSPTQHLVVSLEEVGRTDLPGSPTTISAPSWAEAAHANAAAAAAATAPLLQATVEPLMNAAGAASRSKPASPPQMPASRSSPVVVVRRRVADAQPTASTTAVDAHTSSPPTSISVTAAAQPPHHVPSSSGGVNGVAAPLAAASPWPSQLHSPPGMTASAAPAPRVRLHGRIRQAPPPPIPPLDGAFAAHRVDVAQPSAFAAGHPSVAAAGPMPSSLRGAATDGDMATAHTSAPLPIPPAGVLAALRVLPVVRNDVATAPVDQLHVPIVPHSAAHVSRDAVSDAGDAAEIVEAPSPVRSSARIAALPGYAARHLAATGRAVHPSSSITAVGIGHSPDSAALTAVSARILAAVEALPPATLAAATASLARSRGGDAASTNSASSADGGGKLAAPVVTYARARDAAAAAGLVRRVVTPPIPPASGAGSRV